MKRGGTNRRGDASVRGWPSVVLVAVVVLLGACSAASPTPASSTSASSPPTGSAPAPAAASPGASSECAAAVRTAAVPNDMQEVTSLDRAIRACPTLAELAAAAVAYPAALKGVSAADIVTYRCQVEPTLASTAICRALPK